MNAHRTPLEFEVRYLENCATPVGRFLCAGTARHKGILPHEMRLLNSYAIIILLEGRGRYSDAKRYWADVEAGDCWLLFPDVAHAYGPPPGGPWLEWFFHFEGTGFDFWRQSGLLASEAPVFRGKGASLLPILQEITERKSHDDDAHLRRVCDVLAALGTLREAKARDSRPISWVEHAQHLLSIELNEELPLENVARAVGMSYSTFRARFARETGQTPARFRAGERVRAAQKLLERPELSIKSIARSLGWSDEFAFAKNFKALTGQTPRNFRLQLQYSARLRAKNRP